MYLAPAQNIYRMTGLLVTNKLPSGENAHNVHLYVDGINNHGMIKGRNRRMKLSYSCKMLQSNNCALTR